MDPKRAALIVASDEYQDPGLRRLRAPAHDIEALAGVLGDPQIGDFEVRALLNQPQSVISEAVEEFFSDRRLDDLLLLHFSCHGVKDEGGELYFATTNTKLRLLGATAVAAEFVNRCMNRSRSRRVVLLLDCCYAGAFERGMVARADRAVGIEERFGGRGRAVITASSSMEYAFEGDELADSKQVRPSIFTGALVEGLNTGEADRDQDGYVGLDELYDYVYDRVRENTPNQTPGKWTFGVQGELYIARRSRPVTRPAPLPPEVQQAIDHPLPSVRVAAVHELERLMRGAHAGQALAARVALEGLSKDDSRNVSSAAMTALSAGPKVVTIVAASAAPETAGGTPGHPSTAARKEAATGSGAAAPADLAAGAAAPAPPTDAVVDRGTRQAGDGHLLAAGCLAAGAGALLLVSLFPDYFLGFKLADDRPTLSSLPILAVLASGAGASVLIRRTRRLIGPGILLGIAAASISWLLAALINLASPRWEVGPALWLELLAEAILLVAACLAAIQLVRTGEAHVVLRPPTALSPWLVVLLGVACALSFLVFLAQSLEIDPGRRYLVSNLWSAAMAVLVPTAAVLITPRRFGAALLGGWAGGSVAGLVYNLVSYSGAVSAAVPALIVSGCTLLALLVLVIPLARSGPTLQDVQAT